MKPRFYILFIFIITLGCKDEFLLESETYIPNIVIDGFITNENPPYKVEIHKSSPINFPEKYPLQGCIVTLYENTGKSEILSETEPGIYMTSTEGIKGTIGNSYHISITTAIGNKYESEPQIMKQLVEIDTLYAELDYLDSENYAYKLPGYQFYASTKNSESQDNYLLWQLIETFEFTNDYKLDSIFLGTELITIDSVVQVVQITNDTLLNYYNSELFTCWQTQQVHKIYTGNTSNLTVSSIENQLLHFVGTDSKKLSNRYSLLLKQYSITEQSFYFWENIEKQNSNENFLVANQPSNINGNIYNSDDSEEVIFGNFTVASVSEKRIFVDKPYCDFYYQICMAITDPFSIREIVLRQSPPFYYISTDVGIGLVDESCIDCRIKGGSNKKPDFWINK